MKISKCLSILSIAFIFVCPQASAQSNGVSAPYGQGLQLEYSATISISQMIDLNVVTGTNQFHAAERATIIDLEVSLPPFKKDFGRFLNIANPTNSFDGNTYRVGSEPTQFTYEQVPECPYGQGFVANYIEALMWEISPVVVGRLVRCSNQYAPNPNGIYGKIIIDGPANPVYYIPFAQAHHQLGTMVIGQQGS